MILLYLNLIIIFVLILVSKVIDSADQAECCSKRKDNKLELITLTEIMLELIGKCGPGGPTGISATNKVAPEFETPPQNIPRAPAGTNSCDQLDKFPLDCVNNFCDYDCPKKKCVKGDSIPFVKGDSSTYCFNPCHCNKAGFAYDVYTGDCRDRKPICDKIKFYPGSCQRANKGTLEGQPCPDVYYAYNGVLCKNEVQKGSCEIEETILAVNLASSKSWHERTFNYFANKSSLEPVIDQDNVKYQFDHEVKYHDPKNLARGDQSDTETVNGKRTQLTAVCNRPTLYGSQVWGDNWLKEFDGKEKGWRGITYDIPLTKDGMYELTFKNAENQPRYVVGTRAFNIFFNGVLILPEVDILHTTKILHGVDWIINFVVSDGGKKLKMLGYEDSDLNGIAKLSFYYGICGSQDENFHVAALSVNKLKYKGDVNSSDSMAKLG